ncbi:MAG: response regulator transcription factor [Anaerolineae bacterium]|nr:response regulator transcription factor [Anaerolineae bacterium]
MNKAIRLLVVEDHFNLREQMAMILGEFEGIQVVGEADNGKSAIDLCADLHPDVVLMDGMMPVMDGFTATAEIRQKFPAIRVVMLSNGFLGEELRARGVGASAFLLKPVWMDEIASAVRAAYMEIPNPL